MATFVDTRFSFDGIESEDMYDLHLVQTESGLIEKTFGMPRSTVKEYSKRRRKPTHYGIQEEVLMLNIKIAKEDGWTTRQELEVKRWLSKKTFREFISYDTPDIIYKCKRVGQPVFYTNGSHGYVEIEFECDAPHAYSRLSVETFDLSTNTGTEIIEIENRSNIDDEYYYPEIEVELQDTSTSFSVVNLTDNQRVFEFTDLNVGEGIYVNNEHGTIISSLDIPRLDNLTNRRFFRMKYGVNRIEVTGKVIIQFRCQFPVIV